MIDGPPQFADDAHRVHAGIADGGGLALVKSVRTLDRGERNRGDETQIQPAGHRGVRRGDADGLQGGDVAGGGSRGECDAVVHGGSSRWHC